MIELDGVSKWYPTRKGRRYVFRDLHVQFPQGRHIGVLGRNGAGKSTLLRLIGGIDFPNAGTIRSNSRISWPVGLRSGLHISLTGRENTRFICRICGVKDPDTMREKTEFVEEFADIGTYFDEPVGTYSSGMRARVGFGASMAFEFDYYLLDEIMSVGDASFRRNCTNIIEERRGKSTFILCSHNLVSLKKTCDAGIVLTNGEVKVFTEIEEAVKFYEKL